MSATPIFDELVAKMAITFDHRVPGAPPEPQSPVPAPAPGADPAASAPSAASPAAPAQTRSGGQPDGEPPRRRRRAE